MLGPIFEGLKEVEEASPPELMGYVHESLLWHLKLILAGLPQRRITEEILAAFYARGRGRAHYDREEKLETWYFAVWGRFAFSGAIVNIRLRSKIRKTVCDEEVCGEI